MQFARVRSIGLRLGPCICIRASNSIRYQVIPLASRLSVSHFSDSASTKNNSKFSELTNYADSALEGGDSELYEEPVELVGENDDMDAEDMEAMNIIRSDDGLSKLYNSLGGGPENLIEYPDFIKSMPENATQEEKLKWIMDLVNKAPLLITRESAREDLPMDFPSPAKVPFEDIVKSGKIMQRKVVPDSGLTPEEIYGDYSRWFEHKNKLYGLALSKNMSISPKMKSDIAAIIDGYVNRTPERAKN
ncbi:hypothetical protein V1512DRAFT_265715 [Lipomyces arxii]|uniref:uncharacterized protein n=1 Tax=Lipomyces arxii TaxID=56418 RepID=UPI0034D01173